MERFATPLPCIYSDGDQDYDKGQLGIYAAITFKRFQQLMTQKTGVPAAQLSAVLAYKRNVNGEEKRQKLNINESTNFGIVLRIHAKEIDAHFVIALKRSKKDRKGGARRKAPGLDEEDDTSSTRSESPIRKEATNRSDQVQESTADTNPKSTPTELWSPVSTLPDTFGGQPPSPISPDEDASRFLKQTVPTAATEDMARQATLSPDDAREAGAAKRLEAALKPTSSERETNRPYPSVQRPQANFERAYDFQTENIHNQKESLQTASGHPSGFGGSPEHRFPKQVDDSPVQGSQTGPRNSLSASPKQDQAAAMHPDSRQVNEERIASTLTNLCERQSPAHAYDTSGTCDYAATQAPGFDSSRWIVPMSSRHFPQHQVVSASLIALAVSEALTPRAIAEATVFERAAKTNLPRGDFAPIGYERQFFEMPGLSRDTSRRDGFRAQIRRACKFCVFCRERQRMLPSFHWCIDDPVVPGFRGPSPAGPIERPGKRTIEAAA